MTEPAEVRAFAKAVQASDPFNLFRLELAEVVLTSISSHGRALVIESWRPGRPVARFERPERDAPRRLK